MFITKTKYLRNDIKIIGKYSIHLTFVGLLLVNEPMAKLKQFKSNIYSRLYSFYNERQRSI